MLLNNLAALLDSKGDYDSAEPFCKRALKINEKVLSAEHPNTVRVRGNLERCKAKMNGK